MDVYEITTGYYAGRYIVATWNAPQAEYQSRNVRRGCRGEGFSYAYGRTLSGLAGVGVRTYETLAQATRALRRIRNQE